ANDDEVSRRAGAIPCDLNSQTISCGVARQTSRTRGVPAVGGEGPTGERAISSANGVLCSGRYEKRIIITADRSHRLQRRAVRDTRRGQIVKVHIALPKRRGRRSE